MKLHDIKRTEQSTHGLWWDFERGQRCDAPTDKLCVRIAERDNPMHRACLARLQLDAADKLRQGGEVATLAWNKIQVRAMARLDMHLYNKQTDPFNYFLIRLAVEYMPSGFSQRGRGGRFANPLQRGRS